MRYYQVENSPSKLSSATLSVGTIKFKAVGMIHCGKHTAEYERAVLERIEAAGHNQAAVINTMTDIRNELLNKTFTLLNKRSL